MNLANDSRRTSHTSTLRNHDVHYSENLPQSTDHTALNPTLPQTDKPPIASSPAGDEEDVIVVGWDGPDDPKFPRK